MADKPSSYQVWLQLFDSLFEIHLLLLFTSPTVAADRRS